MVFCYSSPNGLRQTPWPSFGGALGLKLWDTHYMGSTVINTEGTSNMIEFLRIWSMEREREGVVDELQKWWVIPLSASIPFAMCLYCSSYQAVKVCPDLCIEVVVCLDWINRMWQKWHCTRPGLHKPMHIYVLFFGPPVTLRGQVQPRLLEKERAHETHLGLSWGCRRSATLKLSNNNMGTWGSPAESKASNQSAHLGPSYWL